MSRIDIDLLAAKLRVLTKRTQVAVSTSGHIDNIKDELATGILRLATDSAKRHYQLNQEDAEQVANRTAEAFFQNFDKNIQHPFPTRLVTKIAKNKAADHFRQVDSIVDEYVNVDSPEIEPYTKAYDKTPFCLTVTSQVLDAVEDGRIKGRYADGIFMMLDDETNLDSADRQARKRAREKLHELFAEESQVWG
ncbi:MAG: hypothetical protein ACOVP2_05970 [Armatimonadaceae bacterium]